MISLRELGCLLMLTICITETYAQTASLNGFVTDRSDGQILEGATVALYDLSGEDDNTPIYGAASNSDGLYLISRIQPGAYRLQISFVGYNAYRDTVDFVADQIHTITVALEPDPEQLQEVLVESERTTGMARITAGEQRIRPEEITLIPAPDISADLANYLSTLPGTVTTGDRGGQFFVRGGEPSQNLFLLDGMVVYQPFHVLSFYSAFPAEIIDRVDFYAGGFGSKYAGRISSVIDVTARAGDNRRFAAMVSGSPFTGALRFEGPIVPGRASFLLSGRESFIDRTGTSLYNEDLPYRFNDVFGKVQMTPGSRHRFSATGFSTNDRGTLVLPILGEESQEIRWSNAGISGRWLLLPRRLPIATEILLSRSWHEMSQGIPGDTTRSSKIENTRLSLNATFSEGSFFGGRAITTSAGWDVSLTRTRSELGGLFQNVEIEGLTLPALGFYVEPEFLYGAELHVSPGVRVNWYDVRFAPYVEPRLRVEWDRGVHHFSGALGMYHQQIVGLNDRRDPANVFTAWTGIPRQQSSFEGRIGEDLLRGRIGKSIHVIFGYRSTPLQWIEYAVEGFYKYYDNLFVAQWDTQPRFTTNLLPATGRSIGFEVRLEARPGPVYAYLTYGLSNTMYAAYGEDVELWYGSSKLRYHPPHDRRHQVNALVSTTIQQFDVSMRWQFGSGLPYTRPLAFDGFALVDDIKSAYELEHARRVEYEKPFNSLLPAYHRLDASVERSWKMESVSITLQASVINVYDRRNIFYVDVYTLRRKDQLPFIPSIGLKVTFE